MSDRFVVKLYILYWVFKLERVAIIFYSTSNFQMNPPPLELSLFLSLHLLNFLTQGISLLQRIFKEYKQPFVLTYLGVSLMAIFLPIAVFKDWICSLMNPTLSSNFFNDNNDVNTMIGVDIPLIMNGMHQSPEEDLRIGLLTDKYLSDSEEGKLLDATIEGDESHLLKQTNELSSWEIAKFCLYLTPIWFFTEV